MQLLLDVKQVTNSALKRDQNILSNGQLRLVITLNHVLITCLNDELMALEKTKRFHYRQSHVFIDYGPSFSLFLSLLTSIHSKTMITHFLIVDICWVTTEETLLALFVYGWRVKDILLNRGRLRWKKTIQYCEHFAISNHNLAERRDISRTFSLK